MGIQLGAISQFEFLLVKKYNLKLLALALLSFWGCLDGGTTSKMQKDIGISPKSCLFSFSVLTYRPQAEFRGTNI